MGRVSGSLGSSHHIGRAIGVRRCAASCDSASSCTRRGDGRQHSSPSARPLQFPHLGHEPLAQLEGLGAGLFRLSAQLPGSDRELDSWHQGIALRPADLQEEEEERSVRGRLGRLHPGPHIPSVRTLTMSSASGLAPK